MCGGEGKVKKESSQAADHQSYLGGGGGVQRSRYVYVWVASAGDFANFRLPA